MFRSALITLLLLACLSTLFQSVASQDILNVLPNCSTTATDIGNETECIQIDQALKQLNNFTSDITLMLHPGIHVIQEHYTVTGISNLSIIGGQDVQSVVLTCDPGYGLAFLNVSGLQIKGLTIQNCGLSEQTLHSVLQQLEETKELVSNFIFIPPTIRIALFLALCEDVCLEKVTVTNTTGLGLVGINIIGNSSLNKVTFTHNNRKACSCEQGFPRFPFELDHPDQIGGGAYILYLDQNTLETDNGADNYQLSISNSNFHSNSDCNFAALNQLDFQYYFERIDQRKYTVGAGGGLSIFMAQLKYSIEVNIHASNFLNNDARYGSGVYLAFFVGVQDSGVRFSKCAFERNGLSSNLSSYSDGGAGMVVFTDVLRPNDSLTSNEMNSATRNISVELTDTNFTDNSARVQGGGLMTYSQYNTQTVPASLGTSNVYIIFKLTNCVFSGNTATYGAAAFMKQRVLQGVDGGVGIWMNDTQFVENNCVQESADPGINSEFSNADSSALDIQSVQLYFDGDVDIAHNGVTGCSIHSSTVEIGQNTNIYLANNVGNLGGAVRLSGFSPKIVINGNSKITFSGNSATIAGGAIHYSPSTTSGGLVQPRRNSDCFYYPSFALCPRIGENCTATVLKANTTITFSNNKAPLGSNLFGSTLESCPWLDQLIKEKEIYNQNNSESLSILEFINQTYTNGIVFNDTLENSPTDAKLLSTTPAKIVVDNIKEEVSVPLFPGETIHLNATVFDSFGHRIPSVITARVSDNNVNASARLGGSGFRFVDQRRERTPLTVTGAQNQNISVLLYTYDAAATSELAFQIESCPLGFVFNEANSSCACYGGLLNTSIRCDLERLRLIVPPNIWIGPASDDSITNGELVVHRCVRRYCNGDTDFRSPNFDEQCASNLNRKGVLCGACKENYSIAFGSQIRCKQCSNYYLFTILVFIVGGVLLFLFIALFGITVDKGWINMVLFYSNIVHVYSFVRVGNLYQQIIAMPLAILSLKIEIDECLYDGMTSLVAAGLSFTFPLYLFLLMGIFTLVMRRSQWLANHFSPISTFVTLFILCYVNILENCILILSVTRLKTLGGEIFYRWAIDPNQAYFSGGHIFLVLLATLFLALYIIPLPLVLLRPSIAYRVVGKLKPFIDAFYAPFEEKYRFWFSMRLIFRGILYSIPIFLPSRPTVSFIVSAIILVCLTHVQLILKPFKEKWQNILDSTLMVDVIILAIGALFFDRHNTDALVNMIINNIGYTVLVVGAYLVFILIFIIHLRMKYPVVEKPVMFCKLKLQKKPPTSLSSQLVILNSGIAIKESHSPAQSESLPVNSVSTEITEGDSDYHSHVQSNESKPQKKTSVVTRSQLSKRRVDYSAYRESVVEDFVLESVP